MRFALAVLALAAPSTPAQPEAISLHAPEATAYGHRIDFAGRLSPGAPGTIVRLYRGSRFVTSTGVRGDGSFRMQVAVASPGPFVARWQQLSSPPVTVRIVPVLQTAVVGPPIVGAELTLRARLQPAAAGPLRIRVVRGGQKTLDELFYGAAQVRLGTARRGDVDVLVRSQPRPGFVPSRRALHLAIAPPRLSIGIQNPAVVDVTRQLHALHYAVPPASSSFGSQLLDGVYAFQKVQGLDRTGIVDSAFWTRLLAPREPAPRYAEPADHIEVDKAHQVLYIVRGGQIALIVPVSTSGIPGTYTPTGRFAIYRKVTGWDPSPLGLLYDPMYFVAGYAIHGNPSVPPYPASHGCVRVPMWVIPRLFVSEPFGEAVYVY
jgi:L,D-transpeptidase catalytic domain/Putative peptidoglycan binding domain